MSKYNTFNSHVQEPQKNSFFKKPFKFMDRISTDAKVFIGIGLLTLIILFGGVWLVSVNDAKEQQKLEKPLMGGEIQVQQSVHVQGKDHDPYNSDPPTSGAMWNGTAGPGIKSEEVDDELLVHSLEHGAAIVYYNAQLPQDQVEKITNAFKAASGKKIMVPRKNLDVPLALTSWGRLMKLETVDEKIIQEFIETNNDRSPEKMAI